MLSFISDVYIKLIDLLRQNSVQKRVAARVERVQNDQKHFDGCDVNQGFVQKRRYGQDASGEEADEVREDQNRHSLGDARVLVVPKAYPL